MRITDKRKPDVKFIKDVPLGLWKGIVNEFHERLIFNPDSGDSIICIDPNDMNYCHRWSKTDGETTVRDLVKIKIAEIELVN